MIKRHLFLFHIEKDLAHKIENAKKEKDLDIAKKLIKYMFFQTKKNLKNMANNMEPLVKLTEGKTEREIIDIIMDKVKGLNGDDETISHFLDFVKKHTKEVFLYLENMEVEKTSDLAEQHFSIMSWLFKHRFKTKEELLRTSYGYHSCLSKEI